MSKQAWELPPGFEALDAYHADVAGIPEMDPDESARLCLLAQAGNVAARNRVVEGNLKLVAWAAAKFKGAPLDYEDRMQEGMLGLMRGIETFNPKAGYRFSTYVTWWIRQAVSRACDDQGRVIRRPAYLEEALRVERRAEITGEEVAEPSEKVWRQLPAGRAVEHVDRLDRTVSSTNHGGTDPERTLGDTVPDPAPLPEERIVEEDGARWLRLHLAAILPPRLRLVLTLRFGLDGYTDERGHAGRSLEKVSRQLGITRERVRQLEAQALRTLRVKLALDDDGVVGLRRALAKRAAGQDAA